jgi:hypothetical protein
VNAPNIDFARKSQLLPYVLLAEKIGALQAQLIGAAKIRRISVYMQGTRHSPPSSDSLSGWPPGRVVSMDG